MDSMLRNDEMLQTVLCGSVSQERFFEMLLGFLPGDAPLSHWTRAFYGGSLTKRDINSESGIAMLEETRTISESTNDETLEMLVNANFSSLHYRKQDRIGYTAFAARARELSAGTRYLFVESGARLFEIAGLKNQKRWTEASQKLSEFRRMAEITGYPRAVCFVRFQEAQNYMLEGA